jgi:hypothetical protein
MFCPRWGEGTGRGALSLPADRPLKVLQTRWGERAETRMRPGVIAIKPPRFDDLARFGRAAEQVFVEALIP